MSIPTWDMIEIIFTTGYFLLKQVIANMEESFVLQNNQKGCFYYEKYNRRKTKTGIARNNF